LAGGLAEGELGALDAVLGEAVEVVAAGDEPHPAASTAARQSKADARPDMTGLSDAGFGLEKFLQELASDLAIRLRRAVEQVLHQGSEGGLLSRAEVRGGLGVRGDHLPGDRLEHRGVAHLRQALLTDDHGRREPRGEALADDLAALVTVDLSAAHELDELRQ